MIKTARLTIAYAKHTDHDHGMKEVLEAALIRSGVKREDIDIDDGTYSNTTHFGNWVLVPVHDNEAAAKLAAELGTKLDFQQSILEAGDLMGFKSGDKVRVQFMSELGFSGDYQGKISSITDREIIILKKGARSKGWRFSVGDRVTIKAA